MRKLIVFGYKGFKLLYARVYCKVTSWLTQMKFYLNGIEFKGNVRSAGTPVIHISREGDMRVGCRFNCGNWNGTCASGFKARSKIEVRNGARLTIGDNVGITATTIMCFDQITIGNNVMIGVGTHIYDTDFHNIDPAVRIAMGDLRETVRTAPIVIGDNVFIGAFSIILKGVSIGENSVIGAGSVVTKSVPPNQIWAGSPARFVKNLQPKHDNA